MKGFAPGIQPGVIAAVGGDLGFEPADARKLQWSTRSPSWCTCGN